MKSRQDLDCRRVALEKAVSLAAHNTIRPEEIVSSAIAYHKFLMDGPEMSKEDIEMERWG